MVKEITIERLLSEKKESKEIITLAQINQEAFHGNKTLASAQQWVKSLLSAYPVYHYFVIKVNGEVAGYISWQFHGGFDREQLVVELEQLAVSKKFQGQGLASMLIKRSYGEMLNWIATANLTATKIVFTVWFYADNENAKAVYQKFFTDGIQGQRIQYGKPEVMMSLNVSIK
ncbi:GNAT family N-acetyltransferase [Patescibacteria group bacterium]|nr:GNAT family N-acetyltransferase [Patescibacteria group bacterium]